MTAMGRHSPPLDGAVTANGHQLAPFTATPLQTLGPVSVLPRQQDDKPARRRHADGDTVIRVLAAAVVLAVAAFAAIVSYSHIFELGRAHGQDGAAARLLPLSVDGLIASASLVMLYAARNGIALRRVSWPRVMLWLGIGATVTANVGYGLPFGWLAAVVSAWPAVAFVGSVEMAVRFVRDARQDTATATATGDVTPAATGDSGDWKNRSRDKATVVRPELSVEEEAARDGVSAGAVRRRRQRARKAAADKRSTTC